jgi:prefoldin subunit 5
MPVPTRAQQVSMLQADLRCLEQNAELLRRRIEELNAQSAEKATP